MGVCHSDNKKNKKNINNIDHEKKNNDEVSPYRGDTTSYLRNDEQSIFFYENSKSLSTYNSTESCLASLSITPSPTSISSLTEVSLSSISLSISPSTLLHSPSTLLYSPSTLLYSPSTLLYSPQSEISFNFTESDSDSDRDNNSNNDSDNDIDK